MPIYETKKVQDGYRTVHEVVPVYGYRTVQDGWKTVHEHEPVYEEKRVQVGTKTVTEYVPNYVLKKVQTGWKTIPEHEEEDEPEPPEPSEPDEDLEWYRKRMKDLLLTEEGILDDQQEEGMDEPPPWDDEMRRFKMPEAEWGTTEELEYWADRHNISIEVIEDAFDPKFKIKIYGGSIDISNNLEIREAIDQLYADQGGLENLGFAVMEACKIDNCNNPLQGEYERGERPEKRIEDNFLQGWVLQNLCRCKQVSSPTGLFYQRLWDLDGKDIDLDAEWNYEGKWSEILMKQYPDALLAAKWDYLNLMIDRGEDLHEWIEEGMPHPTLKE